MGGIRPRLVRRGDIRFWIEEDALERWVAPRRRTPGGQRCFSNLAIEASLTLGAAFGLRLRQTEGFVRSILELLGVDLRRRIIPPSSAAGAPSASTSEIPRRGLADIVLDSTGSKF